MQRTTLSVTRCAGTKVRSPKQLREKSKPRVHACKIGYMIYMALHNIQYAAIDFACSFMCILVTISFRGRAVYRCRIQWLPCTYHLPTYQCRVGKRCAGIGSRRQSRSFPPPQAESLVYTNIQCEGRQPAGIYFFIL